MDHYETMKRPVLVLVILLFLLVLLLGLVLLSHQQQRLSLLEESLFQADLTRIHLTKEKEELIRERDLLAGELVRLRGEGKRVILTFDDGPSPVTKEVLDILADKGVKAYFFINGINVTDRTRPLLLRAVEEGHVIANHSYSHDYDAIYASDQAFMDDFLKNEKLISQICRRRSLYFRFPGGSRNAASTTEEGSRTMARIKERLNRYGYVFMDWNVTSDEKDPRRMARSLIEQTLWRDRAVVLLHDRADCTQLAQALPLFIDRLLEEGFVFDLADPSREVVQF